MLDQHCHGRRAQAPRRCERRRQGGRTDHRAHPRGAQIRLPQLQAAHVAPPHRAAHGGPGVQVCGGVPCADRGRPRRVAGPARVDVDQGHGVLPRSADVGFALAQGDSPDALGKTHWRRDPRLVRGMCHWRGGVFGRHPAGDGDGTGLPESGSEDLRHRCGREVRGLRAARRLLEGASQSSAGRSPQDLVRGGTHGLERPQGHPPLGRVRRQQPRLRRAHLPTRPARLPQRLHLSRRDPPEAGADPLPLRASPQRPSAAGQERADPVRWEDLRPNRPSAPHLPQGRTARLGGGAGTAGLAAGAGVDGARRGRKSRGIGRRRAVPPRRGRVVAGADGGDRA